MLSEIFAMAKANKAVWREFQEVNSLFEMGRMKEQKVSTWRNCAWYCEPEAVAHEAAMQPE